MKKYIPTNEEIENWLEESLAYYKSIGLVFKINKESKMNKASLEYFKDCEKPRIKQNLEGLLYDLDLLPEQLNREIDGKRYSAIVNLLELIDSLKNCYNCGRSSMWSGNRLECEVKEFCFRGCFGDYPDEWIKKEDK